MKRKTDYDLRSGGESVENPVLPSLNTTVPSGLNVKIA